MSLEAADQMSRNTRFRGRVEAACREIGHGKIGQPGPAGKMAAAAVADPNTVVYPFIAELAADATITVLACPDCGYSRAEDGQIRFVVETHWDEIAARLFPEVG